MYYIQRDSQGLLVRVADVPFDEMTGKLAKDSPEAILWRKNQEVMLSGLQQLRQSDLEMVRVLEDLIQVLTQKGVINITDFPAAAQLKLINRAHAREALNGGLSKLINDEDEAMF
ncbi:tryptophan synthase subunit beta [Candidatus Symbiopectobacterium sp. NZEC135]|uniref:tryptophan synthase subunit beta n=1 Tax=Candidatus Symbiopectobacterium sp. NZEC135 TaxID=2820471 RepID=UPI002226EFB7|nr:tryptophan synthase subunit beta [Candidatus Symbiopectobacterium sp. NZEC135]MCW2477497.1 tryptophan synthase subunit beta [Candidatus Symbiopectobacterium sp. NZEC135]